MGIPGFLKPSKNKIVILAILALAIFLGFTFFGRPRQAPLQFVQVKKQDIKSTVSSSGTLTGKNSASLRFKTSGKLTFINVKAGDQVYAGQVLAGLDTRELTINLQQTQNTLRDKQATVDKVLDDIHLFQYGNGGFVNVGTANETMTQRQLRTTAEVTRDNAFDSVKLDQKDFEDATIVSPINGIVTQAIEVTGQTVTGSDLITQVVDTSGIYFDTEVDEVDLNKVAVGLKAEVTLDTYPNQIFQGIVDQVIPQTKTTSSGATVIIVRIKLDNPKLTFVNGLSGQASIISTEAKGALTIPQEALREDNTVFTMPSLQAGQAKKVTPGIRSDTDVEIKEGLNENEEVLLNPPSSDLSTRNRNPLQRLFRLR